MDVLRTPQERFAELPGFPWQPRLLTTGDGLRLAAVDEGPRDAPVVLLLHGEPTWSFLYRRMIPVLLEAGLRVVAPDLVGFGRSDKPAEESDHTYAAHVSWLGSALLEERPDALGLRDVAMFCQDWGGLIGLRLLAAQPERFRAVCASNTGLPDGSVRLGEVWQAFRQFVADTPDLPVGTLVAGGCVQGLDAAAVAGYDAPFPSAEHKAGPRAMPGLIPQSPDDPSVPDQLAAWEVLRRLELPFLTLFGDSDPITGGGERLLQERIPGCAGQPHEVVAGGGHFIQEDRGVEVAQRLARWLDSLD